MPPMPPPMPPPHPPRPRPIFRVPIVYLRENNCRTVYHNQRRIDSLNSILVGCDNLANLIGLKCDRGFVRRVERDLNYQLAIGVPVGTSCANPTLY